MILEKRKLMLDTVKHLTEKELESLQADYYSEMTGKDLKKKYSIISFSFSLKKCHYLFPVKETESNCPNCGSVLVALEKPRKKIQVDNSDISFCEKCRHEESNSCKCDFCETKRKNLAEAEMRKKKAFLWDQIGFDNFIPISIETLSYREKILLGTLIQAGIEDDFKTLKPYSSCKVQIFPDNKILDSVSTELKSKHIIEFSPLSCLKYFEPNYEKKSFSYYLQDVQYQINIAEIKSDGSIINEFLYPKSWMLDYLQNDFTIWEEIVYWEARSLFDYILGYFNIKYEAGKETEEFFLTVTKQLPISQVYSIIYQCGKNVAAYSKTNQYPKYIAYKSILQNMRNTRDKILAGQFQRWDYNRPEKDCPQSLVSQYYFNTILKLCDKYWTMMPQDFF